MIFGMHFLVWLNLLIGVALLIYGIVSYVCLRRRMDNAVRLEGNVWQSGRCALPSFWGLCGPEFTCPLDCMGISSAMCWPMSGTI